MNPDRLRADIINDIKKIAATCGRQRKTGSPFVPAKEGQTFYSYGLRAPEIYGLFKKYRDTFRSMGRPARLRLAGQLFRSQWHEEQCVGIGVLQHCLPELGPDDFTYLNKLAGFMTNWGITDFFTGAIVQPLLNRHPDDTIALLRRWNRSRHTWKQRASVIAFTRSIGASGRFTDIALELCENLVESDIDLIRKAVGWTLKDVMRGDKKKVLAYVSQLRRRGISSTVTLYAIRDLKGPERRKILNITPMD